MIITTATPVEIDTVLADIYSRRGAALASLEGAKRGSCGRSGIVSPALVDV